jgi:ISXO2-like transposase domain
VRLPAQAARQLPDQSTTLRVDSSSTDDSRLRGALLKRGLYGVYQHVSEAHLKRYLSEFDFRYSNRIRLGIDDVQRADLALKGVVGKRLTYQRTS